MLPDEIDDTWPPTFGPLLERELLEEIAELVPARGSCERLEQIGWWGAAVCWITAPSDPCPTIFPAAAAFNVAVAAFDSLIETDRRRSAPLVDALEPGHLSRVLADPRTQDFYTDALQWSPVAELFHLSLSAFAERWSKNPPHRALGLQLLTEMYRSEIGDTPDPLPAKALPSVFLGMIGTDDTRHLHAHRALGEFLAAWDDWMDTDEDLRRLRPNLFLGAAHGLGTLAYLAKGLALATSEPARAQARAALCHRLAQVTSAVKVLDPDHRNRALGLVRALVA